MMQTSHPVPSGFRLGSVACGIKASGKSDLTLIACDQDAVAAGVYTQNRVFAPSVQWNRDHTPSSRCRAVVINSGNANACTGERGMRDTRRMAALAAKACDADEQQVLVMSTGIIGVYLPMEKIAAGIERVAVVLGSDPPALEAAARGMMTTDKFPKLASRSASLAERVVTVSALAKGAGMIGPQMATMLGVVLTDAPLRVEDADRVLRQAVDVSFNCMSVEGHMSTSDTVLLLASGAVGGPPLAGSDLEIFAENVSQACIDLAQLIPDDGEGSSHLITIDVRGCRTRAEAHRIARTVADSPLVKAGVAGSDPNWGRIVSAAGYAGVDFDPLKLKLAINGTLVFENGTPTDFDPKVVSASMRSNRVVLLELTFAEGAAEVRFWTSDLTPEYVRFNSEYTT